MNEQTGKLLGLLEGMVTSNTKMEIDGRITISRQDYSMLPKRLAKACKEAGLKFVPLELNIPLIDFFNINEGKDKMREAINSQIIKIEVE